MPPLRPSLAHVLTLALALAAAAPGAAQIQRRKLSGPLLRDFAPGANVYEFTVAGDKVVYQAFVDLHTVPLDGSAPVVPIFHPLRSGVTTLDLQLTPDGSRVVFLGDLDTNDVMELYSLAIDGSASPVKLHASIAAGQDVASFRIAPDGERVVFWVNGTEPHGLFSAPLDGSHPAVALSSTLDVSSNYQLTGESSRVVFFGRELGSLIGHFYSAPIDGSAAAVILDPHSVDVFAQIRVAPDGSRIVYRFPEQPGFYSLYSAPADGSGPAVLLHGPAYMSGYPFQISPDSTQVTYVANVDGILAVHSVPITGGNSVPLAPGIPGRTIYDQATSPDGTRVVYLADHESSGDFDYYSVPADGSSSPVCLSCAIPDGEGNVDFVIDPASTRVVFRWSRQNNAVELYSAPLDGTAPAARLSPALGANRNVPTGFQLASGGTRVVFRADPGQASELFSAPLDGSAAPTRLNSTLAPGGAVSAFALDPTGTEVFYRAKQDAGTLEDLDELFVVPVDRSRPPETRSDTRGDLITVGDVNNIFLLPDGATALYQSEEVAGSGLFCVNLQGTPQRTLVASQGWPTPDLQRVVYTSAGKMYSAPLDGSGGSTLIGPTGGIDAYYSPDSSRLVQRFQTNFYLPPDRLVSASVAGGVPPVELNRPRAVNGEVFPPSISRDSSRVVYAGVQQTPGVVELFSVPLAGGAAPVKLNDTLVAGGNVNESSPQISPDSSRVVYLADRDVNDRFELYSVPLAGGAPPTELSALAGVDGDVVSFAISPDSTRVVYVADQNIDEVYDLYSVPLAGGASPIQLSAASSPNRDVDPSGFVISPDSRWVVYRGGDENAQMFSLFRAPLAGGSPPVRLTFDSANNLIAMISPDSTQVIFVKHLGNVNQLCTVSLAGGTAPTPVSGEFPVTSPYGGPLARIDDAGDCLLYSALSPEGVRLYLASLRGLHAPLEIAGPHSSPYWTFSYHAAFRPGTCEVVYGADHDEPGAFELYVTRDARVTTQSGRHRPH